MYSYTIQEYVGCNMWYGFDYYELLEKWGIDTSIYCDNVENEDYDLLKLYVNNILFKNWDYENNKPSRVAKSAIKDIRNFLKAMTEYYDYNTPVWEGLLKIEDDFSFLRMFYPLIPYAWN